MVTMVSPNIVHRTILNDNSNIGCLICRTPKTLSDHRCELINSTNQMYEYFGDPQISPSDYSELMLATKLLRRGIPIYISSLDELMHYNDGFTIPYNGYTEFYFLDSNGYDNVGYRLKSSIKFCQPILSASYSANRLDLYASTFLFSRGEIQDVNNLNKINRTRLYKRIHIEFELSDNSKLTDKDIINELSNYDLELQVINGEDNDTALVDAFVRNKHFDIYFDSVDKSTLNLQSKWPDSVVVFTGDERYRYDVHNSQYLYNLETESDVVAIYMSAIESVEGRSPAPHTICLDRILSSKKIYDTPDDSGTLVRQPLETVDLQLYVAIYNTVLTKFNSDCDTYLLFNMPNVTASHLLNKLDTSNDYYSFELLDNYNADLFYGYAWDFIEQNVLPRNFDKVWYSAALLTFFNLMLQSSTYITNSISDLNISNNCVRSSISERIAATLAESRCNSMVLFNINAPSIYGDRSLSLLPNLRYSHISRNFVRLRRLVREYLETKKFVLNTLYNQRECVDYIRLTILDSFKSQGILSDYTIDFSSQHKTVFISISLRFSAAVETISLDFTI